MHYFQQNATDPAAGQDAARLFEVFDGQDCVATNASAAREDVLPWFGWTCQSPDGGEEFTVPYSIGSFQVAAAWEVNSREGRCWDAAYEGMGEGRKGAGWVAVGAAAAAFVLLIL